MHLHLICCHLYRGNPAQVDYETVQLNQMQYRIYEH